MQVAQNSNLPASEESVDLQTVAQQLRLPPSIHFQRRANEWLTSLRAAAPNLGLSLLDCGRAKVDVFDALRSLLNLSNGAALADLSLARAALGSIPTGKLIIREEHVGADFLDSIALLSASDAPIQVALCAKSLMPWQKLREFAYNVRTKATRRFGLTQSHIAGTGTKVLAIPRMSGHVSDILPVARALRENHGIETVFAVLNRELQSLVRSAGFASVSLQIDSARSGVRLSDTPAGFGKRLKSFFAQRMSHDDLLDPLENQTLLRRTERTVNTHFPYLCEIAAASASLIERINPSLVVVGNPYTLEGRTAAVISRGYGVPTAAIEHGSIFPDDPIWQECPIDRVCTWGNPSKRALMTCGVDQRCIAVTGAPRFDSVFSSALSDSRENQPARDCILVTTSGPGDQVSLTLHQKFVQILHAAVELTPDIQWIVKLHRKDREEFYRYKDQPTHPRVSLVRGDRSCDGLEIFDYLRRARGAVTICSSSALDAMAVRVPVITVDVWSPAPRLQGVEFLEIDCTRRVASAKELAEAAQSVWRGEKHPANDAAEHYASDHFVNRGKGAQTVAEVFAGLTQQRQSNA
jgi:hypothetical protein